MKNIFFLIVFLISSSAIFAQGSTCATADPFCSGSGAVFPNSTTGTAQSGPYYDCLISQPKPSWYYMQIGISGPITLTISQTSTGGNGIDVDFIIWGPFTSLTNICSNTSLSSTHVIDCSFSAAPIETAIIPNALVGQYYMVLITNYNGAAGTIDFSQTGGTGATDCNVLYPCLAFAGNDTTICKGQSVTLGANPAATGNGNITYHWTPSQGLNDSTLAHPLATPNQTTTYYLTMVDDSICTATDSVKVTIRKPIANAGVNDTLTCLNPTLNLDGSASTPGIYHWTSIGGGVISGATTPTPLVGQTGLYILEVNEFGCLDTDTVQIFQDATLPIVNAGTDTLITCLVDTIQLNGFVSGSDLSYFWTGPSIISGDSTLTPLIYSIGSYVLTAKDTITGCQSSSTVHVFDGRTPPVVNAGSSSNLTCVIQSVVLNGIGSATGPNIGYEWTTSNGSIISGVDSIYAVTNTFGTYFLTAYDSISGCSASDNILVTIDTILPIANAGADTSLNCVTLGGVPLNGTNSQSGSNITYLWSSFGGNIVAGATSNYALVNDSATYTLTVTNTTNGCINSDNVLVVIDTIKPIANAGIDTILNCYNPTIALSGSLSTGNNLSYQWTGSFIQSGANTMSPIVNGVGTYTLTITNTSNECTSSDNVNVTSNNIPPGANAGITDSICSTQSILLNGTTTTGDVFLWTTTDGNIVSGSNILTPTINKGGTYLLTVTNSVNGCQSTSSVLIHENFVSSIIGANPITGMMPLTVDFVNLGVADSSYWNFANGQTFGDTSPLSSPSIIFSEQGTYVVTLTSTVGGCSVSTQVTIDVIGLSILIVPNVFTPNGDGKNDVFKFDYKNIIEFNCKIYNRWGKLVNEITSPEKSWDGRNGSDGTYFYILQAKGLDDVVYDLKGTVTLIK